MNINYIPDKEINLKKDDLLGAEPYVNTLSEIITKSDTPFTVGLFGGWGVGKSSIIKTIKDKFNEDVESHIAVFTYDAWKYSNDSFRRTFLFELKEFFKMDISDSFKSFYEDRSEDIEHKLAVKKYSFWWWFTLTPLLLFLIYLFPAQTDLKIITSIISIVLTIITTLLRETFIQYKVTVSKQKIFAPEQFEKIFSEIIGKITGKPKDKWEWIKKFLWKPKKKTKKLVIVIDNIDRCHRDLAFELLLTIKSFLEQKGVVFIIPIDEYEIKKHIKKQGNNPNEFLRKLFNTTISIKNISEGDLFDFATRLNDDYELNFSIEIISIVAQQFSKNPRKIIQFLNVLQTEILLSENQEIKKMIPNGSITENLPFVTKLLIIREEWPNLYNKLKNKSFILENIYNNIKGKEGKYFIDECELDTEQRNFLRRTNHIKPNHNNFELFFINKDSFKNIPDKTNSFVESNDIEGIKEQLENKEIEFDELIKFIDAKFEIALKRGEIKTTIVILLSLIFTLSIDKGLKQQTKRFLFNSSKFLGGFKNFIASSSIKEVLEFVDNKILLRFIKEYEDLSKNILQYLIILINKKENSKQIIIDFIEEFKDEPKQLKEISSKFSKYLSNDKEFSNMVMPLLSNQIVIENLIEPQLIDNYIEKIENEVENEDTIQKLELIFVYKDVVGLPVKQIEAFVTKLISFINSVNDYIRTPYWLEKLIQIIPNVEDDTVLSTNIYSALKSKQSWLWQQYNSLWDREDYKNTLNVFLTALTKLYESISDTNQESRLIAWLTQYYNRNESPELIKFINRLFYDVINKFSVYKWPFSQTIINRFTQASDWELKNEIAKTLNIMLIKTNDDDGLTEQQIQSIFANYINLIDNDNQEDIINWILEALKNKILIKHFDIIINKQNDIRKFELLELLIELNKNEIIENVIITILKDVDCEELESVIDKIENTKVSKDIIIKSIKTVLRNIERERENFECLLENFSISKFSDNVIHNLIAEKVKYLLATEDGDEILFALRIIDNLSINDERKLKAVKALIQDINENNFQEDNLKLVKRFKKKYK